MLGFKRFDNAVVTISGIELAEKIKKSQFKTGKFVNCKPSTSESWSAAIALESVAGGRICERRGDSGGRRIPHHIAARRARCQFGDCARRPAMMSYTAGLNANPMWVPETSKSLLPLPVMQ